MGSKNGLEPPAEEDVNGIIVKALVEAANNEEAQERDK